MSDLMEGSGEVEINKVVDSKKAHACTWCTEVCKPRSKSQYREYFWKEEWHKEHFHLECNAARLLSQNDLGEDGFDVGSMVRGKTVAESQQLLSGVHLCGNCTKEVPSCDGDPTFGRLPGTDNVTRCTAWEETHAESPNTALSVD